MANFIVAYDKMFDGSNLVERGIVFLMVSKGSDHDCWLHVFGRDSMAVASCSGGPPSRHGGQETDTEEQEATRNKIIHRTTPLPTSSRSASPLKVSKTCQGGGGTHL